MKKAGKRALSFIAPFVVALSCVVSGPRVLLSGEPTVSIIPRAPNQTLRGPSSNIKVDAPFVLIPVTATDRLGHPVTDLPTTSFRLFENNVEQRVSSCLREEGPVSIGFIVDASGSMKRWIDHSVAVVDYFLKTRTAGDEWFLVRFSDKPTLMSPFTEDPNTISREFP
jgi:Ca-activated chloride channel family protein